jgi:hypothetical protein
MEGGFAVHECSPFFLLDWRIKITCAAALLVAMPTVALADATESFEVEPTWSSSYDAAWGDPATWTIEAGGQVANALQATRATDGSSAKVLQYATTVNDSLSKIQFGAGAVCKGQFELVLAEMSYVFDAGRHSLPPYCRGSILFASWLDFRHSQFSINSC